MKKLFGCNAAALFALGLVLGGCGGSGNSNKHQDGGTTGSTQICTPNEKTCLNATVAVACNAAGTAVIPTQCGVGQLCTAGACAADPNAACTAADNTCSDSTHALLCTTTGAKSVACATGTTCTGAGVCQGACVVGSSICQDSGTVSTCTDGFHYTPAACGAGTACVQTGTDPFDTAACKPSDCTPSTDGCGAVCGDKTPGGTGTATNTVSTCVPTPTGNKWVAITCPGVQMCDSQYQECSNGFSAGCNSQCNPGDTQCTSNGGFITCQANGTWGTTVTACNADVTSSTYTCFANNSGQGVCGDYVCGNPNQSYEDEVAPGQGACDADGKFHLCGTNGRLGDAQACASGVCAANGNAIGGFAPGACAVECTTGQSRCFDGNDGASGEYQTCVDGLWSVAKVCANGATCHQYTTSTNLPSTYCGCLEGQHQCSEDGSIQTCGSDGTFGPGAPCSVGYCQSFSSENSPDDAICATACFPGKTVCVGDYNSIPGIAGIYGSSSSGTCTAQGTYPTDTTTFTTCGEGTYCRVAASDSETAPKSYGCVACVGAQNENGTADTRCGDADGTGASNTLEVCNADNSGFASTTCTAGAGTCYDPKVPHDYCSYSAENAGGFCYYGTYTCGTTTDCCLYQGGCYTQSSSDIAYCR